MAYTDSEDLNYLGEIFNLGGRTTPFLNRLGNPIGPNGGVNSNVLRLVDSFEFAVAQPVDTGAGSQPAITEAASVTGQTATTFTRGQDVNTVQIFQRTAEVSYKKQSTTGTVNNALSGVHNVDGVQAGIGFGISGNPVTNELDFQVESNLKKMASDLEVSCIQGSYQGAASAATAAKTRGLTNAIATNAVAAGSAALTTTHVNGALKAAYDGGAEFGSMVALCNSYQMERLAALYEYVPQSRTEGGANIRTIYTQYCELEILTCRNVPTDSILFVDMTVCRIVVCPVTGLIMRVEPIAKSGASDAKQMYLQAGLDYGPEEFHAKITGLATS